jgi:hypothetical protein
MIVTLGLKERKKKKKKNEKEKKRKKERGSAHYTNAYREHSVYVLLYQRGTYI